MQQHCEQFVGKQRRQEGKYLGISEAEPLVYNVNQFSPQGQHRSQFSVIYEV